MRKRKASTPKIAQTAAAGSPGLLSSWITQATLYLLASVAMAAAVFWIYKGVTSFYSSAQDAVLSALGLGVVPVVLWLAAFVGALAARRAWLYYPRPWLASATLVLLVLGAMGAFQPSQGALAAFTLHGEVSLGGSVGRAIFGPNAWLGALRLLGIFLAGLTIISPPAALGLAEILAQSAQKTYLFLAVVAGGVLSTLRLRRPRPPARDEYPATDEIEPSLRPTLIAPYSAAAAPEADLAEAATVGRPSRPRLARLVSPISAIPAALLARSPKAPKAATQDDSGDAQGQELEDIPSDDGLEQGELQPGQATNKFNKFGTSPAPASEGGATAQKSKATPPLIIARRWARPSKDLLSDASEGGISEDEMQETAEVIKKTLGEYGIEVEIGQIEPGPTVTMYGLIPGWVRRYKQEKATDDKGRPKLDKLGKPVVTQVESKTRVKVDSILSRGKDLELALKTPSIRIETPAMGRSQLGIEVPNPNAGLVPLRSVMESSEFTRLRAKAHLPIALGKGSGGETVVADLAKMPHLLIAGATGSGKSVCINTIVSCLVLEKTPEDMRLLLVDPKRVELTSYNGIPHLLTPVVVETDKVVGLLKGMIREMLDRYRRMEEVGVRNIESYNRKEVERMPYLVVAIDELADLMMSAAFDVEQCLCRLAQLGRATGIHLIVATQRPSVDVVTGLIKANFPSRISFGVTSHIDSRTILDSTGAEKLLGRGDMLYLPLDASRPARIQGVFISDREIESLVNFWRTTPRSNLAEVSLRAVESDRSAEGEEEADDGSQDELMAKAIELAHSYNKVSTSLLQRRLRIGYPRAARLVDQLEEQGIIGPSDGSKSREVIISRSQPGA